MDSGSSIHGANMIANSVSRTRGPYGQHAVLRLSRRYCAIIFAARRTPCLCLKTVHRHVSTPGAADRRHSLR